MDTLLCSIVGHPIVIRIRVKNPGTDSTFESLMNFPRDLVGITCMQDIELQYKCQTAWFE
jgi:hypothetical protein